MDFKLDDTGDIAIENGDFVLISGIDATVQFLNQGLKLILGEWFLDETAGFPYFDEVFVKNPNVQVLDSLFRAYIIDFPGVEELLAFSPDLDVATRELTISGRIRGLDGEADFSVASILPGGA